MPNSYVRHVWRKLKRLVSSPEWVVSWWNGRYLKKRFQDRREADKFADHLDRARRQGRTPIGEIFVRRG